jgi:hypothetical protein
MAEQLTPYIDRSPGDLITAEDWDDVQIKIKEDIAAKISTAINAIKTVPYAENAGKLSGQTTEELTKDIIDKALAQIPTRTGYRRLFKVLKFGEEEVVIKHDLHEMPLVDVYQLDYFRVVCSEDDEKYESWVTFYLYHSSEKKLRYKPEGGTTVSIDIEPTDGHVYRIPFTDMLLRYNVSYTDTSSLEDLENDFWKAFFAAPNDEFDDDQYCHSPWFDRCCRERSSVSSLKQKGDWDDVWFQMRPRRTVNFPVSVGPVEEGPTAAPTQVQVTHFDFDTLGVRLLAAPIHRPEVLAGLAALTPVTPQRDITNELKVMLLLKV